MKYRYIVRTFVEASNPQEALRLAKKTNPHEAYIDNEMWKLQDFALTDKQLKIGFKKQ
jgi:hypothetical protein